MGSEEFVEIPSDSRASAGTERQKESRACGSRRHETDDTGQIPRHPWVVSPRNVEPRESRSLVGTRHYGVGALTLSNQKSEIITGRGRVRRTLRGSTPRISAACSQLIAPLSARMMTSWIFTLHSGRDEDHRHLPG